MEGFSEYLTIEDRFLVNRDGVPHLAVSVIGKDRRGNRTLIQLPYEADSGANRVWVPPDAVVSEPDEVPA